MARKGLGMGILAAGLKPLSSTANCEQQFREEGQNERGVGAEEWQDAERGQNLVSHSANAEGLCKVKFQKMPYKSKTAFCSVE